MTIETAAQLRSIVDRAIDEVQITDMHTHIYDAGFGDLLLWGIDELLVYHYLVAETFRYIDMPYETFWAMSKREQADLIWKTLFLDNTPYSEACRGVLTVLHHLDLDVSTRDLDAYRRFFAGMERAEYLDLVFKTAHVKDVVMTNDPFDDLERPVWEQGGSRDPRFKAALRIDPLLNGWEDNWPRLRDFGYAVTAELSDATLAEVRRFLTDWVQRMGALYMAVSLPPSFAFPEASARGTLINECILPVCAELNIPFAMMIGVKKLVNPDLRLAGDSVGPSNVEAVEYLCANFPRNKFMVTMLDRVNQHELCIVARKFRNLLLFGCWWFLNNPVFIDEMTRMRMETLGVSFIPQHSDARVLDQLIYKWAHSREIIGDVLYEKYLDIANTGWQVTEDEVRRDVENLFGGYFWSFLEKKLP
jgi:hypothetical protein